MIPLPAQEKRKRENKGKKEQTDEKLKPITRRLSMWNPSESRNLLTNAFERI